MLNIELHFLYKSTYLPTRAVFYGVHKSTDFNFGSSEFKDPFVGSGAKIKALVDAGAKRRDFLVENVLIGTEEQCEKKLKEILAKINYDHPLALNSREGAPAGVPKSPAHKAAIAEGTAKAMVGNDNALGTTVNQQAILTPEMVEVQQTVGKLKWFNDGIKSKMIAVDADNKPVDPLYNEWKLGQLKKPK